MAISEAFVYLTDVDDRTGPHIFVSGSPKTKGRLRGKPYSEEEVEAQFGMKNVQTILSLRGRTLVADTIGIHAGMPPQRAPRLLLQAQYSTAELRRGV